MATSRRPVSPGFLWKFAPIFLSAPLLLVVLGPAAATGLSGPSNDGLRFSGARAYKHVEKLVSFGPRSPGSAGWRDAQAYIAGELRHLGLKVREESFIAHTPYGPIEMKNIIGEIAGARPEVVAVGGHYDTLRADGFLFLGANDGGSSAGALLELARVLAKRKNRFTIWLVFFDGEEAFRRFDERDGLYGSRYMVRKLQAEGQLKRLKALILLDMIGDKDLAIENEAQSTPWLREMVREAASELGLRRIIRSDEKVILDDHVPFIEAGVPAVDIIDLDYGFSNIYWHSSHDTLDKIAPASLEAVGKIVLGVIAKLEKRLLR